MKTTFLLLFPLLSVQMVVAQDSLTREQLEPLTYTFTIEDGQLSGPGAVFLAEAMTNAQFTMIGEYHGSRRISEFTEALIPELEEAGYQTLALEVGPVSGQILNGLEPPIVENLRAINDRYLLREEDGYANTPIPFFDGLEDAAFLEEAISRDWQVLGIDQEYFFGYQMLLDRMFANLNDDQQAAHKALYSEASDSLSAYYWEDINGEEDLAVSIKNSKVLEALFVKMAEIPANVPIIEALETSNHIYWLNASRQWFENNATRVQYMKTQLRLQLQALGFDLSQDKLLIKMGGYHMSKGFSPLGLFEVGNMLNELANFHGNTTLNITFSTRFYLEDGELYDILEETGAYYQQFRDLNQMGRKDEWVVIDLRPMIKGHFYRPVVYQLNERIEELVQRYDLLVIPPVEMVPTPNYSQE